MAKEFLTESQWQEIINFYRKGASFSECKKLYYISAARLREKLKQCGNLKAIDRLTRKGNGRFAHIK